MYDLEVSPIPRILSDAKEVRRSINNKKVVIVDARSRGEFVGSEVRAARRGHIPSAKNVDWIRNLENGIFKNKKELSKIYSKIPRNAQIITYCHGGYRATNTFLVLKMLGYRKVKVYLASWGEWGNRLDLPIEQ